MKRKRQELEDSTGDYIIPNLSILYPYLLGEEDANQLDGSYEDSVSTDYGQPVYGVPHAQISWFAPGRKRVKLEPKGQGHIPDGGPFFFPKPNHYNFSVPNIALPPPINLHQNPYHPHHLPNTNIPALTSYTSFPSEFVPQNEKLRNLYETALLNKPGFLPCSKKKKRTRRRKARRKPPADSGRKDKRQRMHCAHCDNDFWAKPTERDGRFVLNHKCAGIPRRQYVVGGWHRKCSLNHYPPCIDFVFNPDDAVNNLNPAEE